MHPCRGGVCASKPKAYAPEYAHTHTHTNMKPGAGQGAEGGRGYTEGASADTTSVIL